MKKSELRIYAGSTIGSRKENQDNLLIDDLIPENPAKIKDFVYDHRMTFAIDDTLYFMVCDGMGGGKDGKVASKMAVNIFGKRLKNLKENSNPIEVFKAFLQMNQQITNYYVDNGQKGGTTCSLLEFHGDGTMRVYNVGDSPVYHMSRGKFTMVSEEQNVAGLKRKQGKISQEEYEHSNEKRMLMGFLGDRTEKSLLNLYYSDVLYYNRGDYILLCSDGLPGSLGENALMDMIECGADAEELLDETKDKKGNDNITLILLEII